MKKVKGRNGDGWLPKSKKCQLNPSLSSRPGARKKKGALVQRRLLLSWAGKINCGEKSPRNAAAPLRRPSLLPLAACWGNRSRRTVIRGCEEGEGQGSTLKDERYRGLRALKIIKQDISGERLTDKQQEKESRKQKAAIVSQQRKVHSHELYSSFRSETGR